MTTARYAERNFYYGTIGFTYGARSLLHPRLTAAFEVDWNNDGVFDGGNEAGNIYSIETTNGRVNFLRGTGDNFEPVAVGQATLLMRNNDGRYDPYNVNSPLYGNILPGRRYQLRLWDEVNEVYYPIMKGRIDDIRPIYGQVDNVRMILSNGVRQMKNPVKTTVQSSIRFDDAVELLLANWEDGTDIDTTVSETMTYWWASNHSLFDELNSVANAALGIFFVAEDGKGTYISRVSGDIPLVNVNGTNIDLDYGIRSPTLWDVVKNKVRVYARARSLQSNAELWRMTEVLQIPAGATKIIWTDFSFNGEDGIALVVTTPVATTDYLANSQADGLGSNLTANTSITITKFATTSKLEITNTGGTLAHMTLLKVRGDAIVADKYTFVEDEDTASIEEYGEFEYIVKTDWLQDINTATDEASILISRLSTARQFPRVKLVPNPEIQFNVRLLRLVNFSVISKNISGQFRAGYISHRSMDETLQTFETEVYFEPNLFGNTEGTWVFPATFGTTTVF